MFASQHREYKFESLPVDIVASTYLESDAGVPDVLGVVQGDRLFRASTNLENGDGVPDGSRALRGDSSFIVSAYW